MERISTRAFVHTVGDIWGGDDRHFCFVLGAGASRTSGIKTGSELATRWLQEIKDRIDDERVYQEFLTKHNIDEHLAGQSYPRIYHERFTHDKASGFDCINKEMESARPGYGYSVLAQILAAKHHNVVITTNFDNLTEEALYTYTDKRPLVCGHESLAAFAKPSVKRPLIVKIHRDRFLDPMSQPDEVEKMNDQWITALNSIFRNAIPIFIGYGGNDGSLMGYLNQIPQFENIFWCEQRGSAVSNGVEKLLSKHDGKLVEIDGFDEVMWLLQAKLGLDILSDTIVKLAEERKRMYDETLGKITERQAGSSNEEAQDAARQIVKKATDNWWSWQLMADSATDEDARENIYKQALAALPQSPELNESYAIFLENTQKNYPAAEFHYKRAVELDKKNANYNGKYATFLLQVRKNVEEAEYYYKRALEADPNHAINNSSYAFFLTFYRKDYRLAEEHFKRALAADPDDANSNGNYAIFLESIKGDYEQANKHYLSALTVDPDNFNKNLNYAIFLKDNLKDFQKAEKYYQQAHKIEPKNANGNCSYAGFLLGTGRLQEGMAMLESTVVDSQDESLLAELRYYQYAHVPEQREKALEDLRQLICKGVRHLHLDFQLNLSSAIADGHSDPEMLKRLASILTKDVPVGDLCDKYSESNQPIA